MSKIFENRVSFFVSQRWWRGWKSHIVWADGAVPLIAVTTSASLSDSQAAIPIIKAVTERTNIAYALMDRGYDVADIRIGCRAAGLPGRRLFYVLLYSGRKLYLLSWIFVKCRCHLWYKP